MKTGLKTVSDSNVSNRLVTNPMQVTTSVHMLTETTVAAQLATFQIEFLAGYFLGSGI